MCWHGSANGKRGRSQKYSEAAIQFCLTIKGLFNLALRQAMGLAQSLLKLAGLDWEVPDFSTVSRRQKHLAVTITANKTTSGLHLLVDSTGIKMLGEVSGKQRNMVPTTAVSGARFTLELMPRPWKSGPLKSRTTPPAMRRCCHACSTKLARTKSSLASVAMVPTTPSRVMARDFDRQVAELQVRAAILNRLTQLGTPITLAMA